MNRSVTNLTLRELQRESARVLIVMEANNLNIMQFNKVAHHDSQLWHQAVINWYIEQYGGYPSQVGPGVDIKLISDK